MKDIYFSHDVGAFSDPKMRKLRSKYGMEGYGIYWAVLESLRREDSLKLDNDDEYLDSLGYDLRTNVSMREFVDDCIRWGLFSSDGDSFFSEALIRRCEEAAEKSSELSKKRREAVSRRWNKEKNADVQTEVGEEQEASDAIVIQNDTSEDQLYYKPIQGDTSKSKSKSKRTTTSSIYADVRAEEPAPAPASRDVASYLAQAGVDMTPGLWEELREFLSDGITAEMVCMAVDDAIKNGAKGWAYIAKILNRWIVSGVRSPEDVKREREAHDRRTAERDRERFASGPPQSEQKIKFL